MTPDESREQKAMLLLEYQEAQQSLAELRESAIRKSQLVGAVSQWLEDAGTREEINLSRDVWVTKAAKKIDAGSTEARAAMNFDEIAKLIQEIAIATGRLRDLQKRKQSVGLK